MSSTNLPLDEVQGLHKLVCDTLVTRLKSEDCKPADIANAIKFLKDNDITGVLEDNKDLQSVVKALPFPESNTVVSLKK